MTGVGISPGDMKGAEALVNVIVPSASELSSTTDNKHTHITTLNNQVTQQKATTYRIFFSVDRRLEAIFQERTNKLEKHDLFRFQMNRIIACRTNS